MASKVEYFKKYIEMKLMVTASIIIGLMIMPIFGNAQLVSLSGKIVNSESGMALENVNVLESFSNIGTISNANGYFKLLLTKGELEMKITNDGFRDISQQISLKGDTTISVRLEPEIQNRNKNKKQDSLQANLDASKKVSGNRRSGRHRD